MTQLLKFISLRVSSALLTLLGVSIFIFLAIHMLPGSFADVLAPRGPEELRLQIAEKFGLDQPLPIQYLKWLGSVSTGDLGKELCDTCARHHRTGGAGDMHFSADWHSAWPLVRADTSQARRVWV